MFLRPARRAGDDGHDYIASALQKGSPVCLAERVPEGVGGGVIVVPDVQRAMAELAREVRGRFTGPVVGIVGSSGKTTTKEMWRRRPLGALHHPAHRGEPQQ